MENVKFSSGFFPENHSSKNDFSQFKNIVKKLSKSEFMELSKNDEITNIKLTSAELSILKAGIKQVLKNSEDSESIGFDLYQATLDYIEIENDYKKNS